MSKEELTYNELLKLNKQLSKKIVELENNEKKHLKTLKKLEHKKEQLKSAKNNAEEYANLLLKISDNIPAYISIIDAKTLILKFVNSIFANGFKKTKQEIIGSHLSKVIGKKNTDFAMPYINKVRNGEATSYINTFNVAEGKRIAKVNYVPGYNDKGEVIEIIVLTQDITALKTSEEDLKKAKTEIEQSEKRFKALHNASFGGIAIHDKGIILDCNQGLVNLTGFSMKELVGMNGLLLIAEETRAMVMDNIINHFDEPYEAIGLKKNGDKYPLRIDAKTVPYNNKLVRVTEFRDITQQKKYEQQLIEQNERFEQLNEQLIETNINLTNAKNKAENREEQLKLISNNFVNVMIYQVISIDEVKRQFTYLSNTVNKLYGCTPEDAFKDASLIYSKIHPDHTEKLVLAEKEALEKMSIFKVEAKVLNPDGSTRWSYFVSKPRIIKGVTYWDGLEFDITERKKLEQDLIDAKNKAEESDRLKSAFLANMSHEIRTPMNSILGFSELLKENDLEEEEKTNYLNLISQGGNQLLTIISDIVDVSKIDANQLILKIDDHNLNKIIDALYKQFNISNKNKAIELRTTKALPDDSCTIKTDIVRLKQILSNLIENALKFTKDGYIEFGYTNQKDHFLFFVKDTGIGIHKKYHTSVFDRFSQINDDFFYSGSGTGLGLSIVKGLIELLHGQIWIESNQNKGTIFFFKLPK